MVRRCYEEKSGQSWENVLQHVQKNLDYLPLSSPVVDFYLEQDSQQAVNRYGRIVRSQLKAAAESSMPVSGPMSDVLSSKMRYAKKITPEDQWEAKLSHLSNIRGESSLDEQSDEKEKKAKSESSKDKRKRRSKGKGKRKAEDAHVSMCNKAMFTLDKVNKLLDKFADSSSSSD